RAPWQITRSSHADSVWPLATAAALFIATIVGVRFGASDHSAPAASSVAAVQRASGTGVESVTTDWELMESQYQQAIGELQQAANNEREVLDAASAESLWTTMADVDRAIDESRAALTANPSSEPAHDSLIGGLRTKLALLQDTLSFINTARRMAEG